MHGDARQPGREARAARELVEVLERAHVGVLHDVLGLVLVPEDGPRHAVEPLVVPANEHLEQRRLPRAHALTISSSERAFAGVPLRGARLAETDRCPFSRLTGPVPLSPPSKALQVLDQVRLLGGVQAEAHEAIVMLDDVLRACRSARRGRSRPSGGTRGP